MSDDAAGVTSNEGTDVGTHDAKPQSMREATSLEVLVVEVLATDEPPGEVQFYDWAAIEHPNMEVPDVDELGVDMPHVD